MKILWSCILCTCALLSCATPPLAPPSNGPSDAAISALRAFVVRDMARKDITGMSIAVSDSQGIIWSDAFGRADIRNNRAFATDTRSLACSVSKVFTSTAILQLHEEGKLDIDRPVGEYLPELQLRPRSADSAPVTLRTMLTHHSGLPCEIGLHNQYGSVRPAEYPNLFQRYGTMEIDASQNPKTSFAYSNYSIALLGLIVEKVSGLSFEDYMQTRVFKPAGLRDSSFVLPAEQDGRYARGYTKGKESPIPYLSAIPAAGLISTAEDLGRYGANLLAAYRGSAGILKTGTTQEMWTPQNPLVALDGDFRIGLTWWSSDSVAGLEGERIVFHQGDVNPFHAIIAIFPERDLCVSVMVNSADETDSFALFDMVAESVRVFAARKGQPPLKGQEAASPIIALPSNLAARYAGTYTSFLGPVIVKAAGPRLKVNISGTWLDGRYHEDGSIDLVFPLGPFPLKTPYLNIMTLSLEDIAGRELIGFRLRNIRIFPLLKVETCPPDDTWKARVGVYAPVDPQPGNDPIYQGFELIIDPQSGNLAYRRLAFGSWKTFPLTMENDSVARLQGAGRDMGDTVRAFPDGTLLVSGMKLAKRQK